MQSGTGSTALTASTFSGATLFSAMLPSGKSSNITTLTMLPAQLQTQFQGMFWLVAAAVAAVSLLLLLAFVLLAGFNWSKPRILILHSLDKSERSVVKTDERIRRILAVNRQPVVLRWHYLGMNRLTEEAARQRQASLAHRSIEKFDPAIIIAVDDEAQQYVAQHYAGHERIKLVFTAIDQVPEDYGYIDRKM